MPVADPDGGLIYQGYDIGTIKGAKALPVDKTATVPFYFGGSQVPTRGVEGSQIVGGAVSRSSVLPSLSPVKVLPSVRMK